MTTVGKALSNLVENIQRLGLEYIGRYYGAYRGVVFSNEDPEGLGRVQVVVPQVGGNEVLGNWCDPMFQGCGDGEGEFNPPEKFARIWVMFEHGDVRFPIYPGGFWAAPEDEDNEVPAEFRKNPPTAKGWFWKAARFIIENEAGEESVTLKWRRPSDGKESFLNINKDGSATLQDHKNNKVLLNAENGSEGISATDFHGNEVSTSENQILLKRQAGAQMKLEDATLTATVTNFVVESQVLRSNTQQAILGEGAIEPIPKGNALLSFFNKWLVALLSHVHTSSPTGGPTSPPVGLVLNPYTPTLNSTSNTTI
jgi:hypothetical protein